MNSSNKIIIYFNKESIDNFNSCVIVKSNGVIFLNEKPKEYDGLLLYYCDIITYLIALNIYPENSININLNLNINEMCDILNEVGYLKIYDYSLINLIQAKLIIMWYSQKIKIDQLYKIFKQYSKIDF